jgi:RNA polymerase sigma-70 factor (ECF subfamily)
MLEKTFIITIRQLYNYFYKSILNFHTAEDLTEDTFLKALKYFSNFRGDSSMKTWLFKIARNTLIDYLNESKSPTIDITEYAVADEKDHFSCSDDKFLIKKVLLMNKQ